MTLKKLKFVAIILVLSFVIGCAQRQVVLTPNQESDRAYYEALNRFNQAEKEFTDKLIKYNDWCEIPAYSSACKTVDPYWTKANDVLDAWKSIVNSRKNDTAAQNNYHEAMKELKTTVLMNLNNYKW